MDTAVDILALMGGDDKPFSTEIKEKEEEDTFDYWANPEVVPAKPDVEKFKVGSKSFLIATYTANGVLPAEVHKELFELAKALVGKGYRFRHTGDVNDKLQNEILKIEDIEVDSYLPWKKFNPDIANAFMKKPAPIGYKIAANSHKGFKGIQSNGIRCILARNAHAILGPKCVTPVSFILAYTEDGAEALAKGLDYKVTGNVAFYLKVAEDSNVPVFNIKKDGAVKRLVELIQKQ